MTTLAERHPTVASSGAMSSWSDEESNGGEASFPGRLLHARPDRRTGGWYVTDGFTVPFQAATLAECEAWIAAYDPSTVDPRPRLRCQCGQRAVYAHDTGMELVPCDTCARVAEWAAANPERAAAVSRRKRRGWWRT